jgi:hypothetical protein
MNIDSDLLEVYTNMASSVDNFKVEPTFERFGKPTTIAETKID